MNKKLTLSLLVCFALLVPFAIGRFSGTQSFKTHPSIAARVSGANNQQPSESVIIGFKDRPDPSLVQASGGKLKHQFTTINAIAAEIPEKAVVALQGSPQVAYIEKDQEVHLLGETLPWGVDRIDADKVWGDSDGAKTVTSNAGGGQQVAVVDTGIDYTHPDLDGNYIDGYDYANGDNDPKDDNGHGTHVSGTIAAEENTEGVIGVAPNTGLYALKALDKRGSGSLSDIVAAIEWAVKGPDGTEGNEDDAEVVSMSLGTDSGSSSLKDAVQYALSHGTLPVAASGNDGDGDTTTDEYSYPAAYDSVIAVGATDKDDSLASFSNTGPYLELAAPGVDINSTMPTYNVHLNTGLYQMSQDYDTMDGTSMACPHVSGTAALVYAAGASDADGDGNVADDVRSILDDTAEDLGSEGRDNGYGYGLVDAEAATGAVSTGDTPTVSWVNPTDGDTISGNVTIQIDASDTEDSTGSLTVEWQVDDGTWYTATYNSDSGYYEDTWDSSTVSDGTHTLDTQATDSDGNIATDSISVTTDNTDSAPTVSWVNPTDGDTVQGMVEIQLDASDDKDSGSDLTVEWQVDDGTWNTATYNSTSGYYEDTWNSSMVSDGDHNLDARATDSSGNTASENRITVTVNNEVSGNMYVWDISFQTIGPHLEATVTIRIDSDGDGVAESLDDPVNDATVDIAFTYDSDDDGDFDSNDNTKTYTGTTDSSGEVSFKWKQASSGDYKVEATNVTHDSYNWNSDLDADNPAYYTL